MDKLAVGIRPATERDQQAIRALVRSERLNPTGLYWPNFVVAVIGSRIVGAVQMRKHSDGSRELGSLVVRKEARGSGLSLRMIDALLSSEHEPVWMITAEPYAGAYSRWGFKQIEARTAPVKVRRNHLMGSLVRVISFVMQRPMRRLVILERRHAPRLTVPSASMIAMAPLRDCSRRCPTIVGPKSGGQAIVGPVNQMGEG